MITSRITGTGHYVPARVLTNFDLEKRVETSDSWIRERTGIRERRIASQEECTSDMAAAAALNALRSAEVKPEEIDLVIVATVTPDMPLPSTAMFVKQKIGARQNCPGFDLAAACAGFIYGLSVADKYIRAGEARHVLLVGVELLSRVLNWSDRTTCVLFGDGAGAVVVSASSDNNRGILSTHLYSDASFADALRIPAGGTREPASLSTVELGHHLVHMEGQKIFKFAVTGLADACADAIAANGLTPADVDWVVPHQANVRILRAVSARCSVPIEKFYLNIQKYGNTSSASVPIALDEAVRDGSVKAGQTLVLCALGGGIAWGSALMRW